MAIAVWSHRYETGIDLIDHQHRTLFDAVNQLAAAFKTGTAQNQVIVSLDFLAGYTVEHFQTEERFMKEGRQSD